MRHPIICLLLLLSTTATFAQNWSLFNANEKFHFQLSNDSVITHTLEATHFDLQASDTTFYLSLRPRFVTCDPPLLENYCIRNDGAAFGFKEITRNADDSWVLMDTVPILLLPRASLGKSWSCNSQGLTASISSVGEQNIFGMMDSVKTISLSSGHNIRIAKSFGIIQLPHWTDTTSISLVGIEERNLGKRPAYFQDIFDFQVGDEFEYLHDLDYSTGTWDDTHLFYQYKYRILSRQDVGDTILYTVKYMEKQWEYPVSGQAPPPTYTVETRILKFTEDANDFLNLGVGELGEMGTLDGTETALSNYYSPASAGQWNGKRTRFAGFDDYQFHTDNHYVYAKESPFNGVYVSNKMTMGLYYRVYAEGIGLVKHYRLLGFLPEQTELLAYQKGTESYGTLSEDWFFTDVEDELDEAQWIQAWRMDDNRLSIQFGEQVRTENWEIEVMDASGRQIMQAYISPTQSEYTIELGSGSVGFYMVRMRGDRQEIIRKWMNH